MRNLTTNLKWEEPYRRLKMFVKITRINEQNHEKELLVNTEEIVFLSETEPHVNYDKPTKYEDTTDEDTGVITKVPVEWETTERFLIAFKNGKHPQFLDRANYEKLTKVLTK